MRKLGSLFAVLRGLCRWFSVLVMLFIVSGCNAAPSVLDPRGPAAGEIRWLSWVLIGMGLVVYVGVCGFLVMGLLRGHQDRRQRADHTEAEYPEDAKRGHGIVVWGGIVMPAVVLLIIAGLTFNTLMALSARSDAAVTIDVIGHQWWWEVKYPEYDIITANEIHIPVGQPVRINLTAAGVVHSFWVPQLHGKLDMIPGHTNTFQLQADTAGEYRGICAEFCGIQHARMLFLVIAQPPDEFTQWLETHSQPAAEPVDTSAQQGRNIFLSSTCAQCHAIAGTEAEGRLGPDLTHFASRREIAAGTLANNRGNLAGWIIGPQELKPGNLMPATDLSGADLQALLDYLATLK